MTPALTVYCASVRETFRDQAFRQQCTLWRDKVEFLMLHDNDWQSTSRKMQRLVEMARGRFVMQVADDDIVHPQLLPAVVPLLDPKLDCVTYDVQLYPDLTGDLLCRMSPDYYKGRELTWCYWNDDETIQYRMWHPLMPTNKRLFENVEWPDTSYGEDNKLLVQVAPKIQKWKYIPRTLYFAFPSDKNPHRKDRSPRYE